MHIIPSVRGFLLAGVAAVAPAMTQHAAAQSVDYGALEQLYGESVTTSVTGKPQKASDAPANLVIITADEIRRSGATNIPDLLRYVPGLDVRRYSATQADVAVQGYNQSLNPRLLVLLNGRQVYVDTYGFVDWSLIPVQLEEIRQIEVVKGPNSALFGFNAASGVINIITYDPLFDSVNAATLRAGSQSLLQGSAVGTLHLGDAVGLRFSAGGLQQHEFDQPAGSTLAPGLQRNPRSGNFNIDGKARLAQGVEVTLGGSYATSQEDQYTPGQAPIFTTSNTNSVKAGLMADTSWGTIALNAYRNELYQNPYVAPLVGINLRNVVYVLQATDTLRLNADHTMRVGLEYRNNTLSGALSGGAVGEAVYSASGMWDWQINPSLSLTNSARVDYVALNYSGTLIPGTGYTASQYNNTTIAAPSFNSGLVYKLSDIDSIRISAGRGLQVPSLLDFGMVIQGAGPLGSNAAGNPTLQPTAVWNLELGYDRTIAAIGSTLRTSVFLQRNDRLLTAGGATLPRATSLGTLVSVAQNTGYSDSIGGEIGIKGHSESGFRWNASYSFQVISDHTTNNTVMLTSPQNYQDGTPTNVLIVGGGYTWDKLEIDAQGRWQSRFTDYRSTSTGLAPLYVSDYVTFMGRIGYALTEHMTLALTGQQFYRSRLVQSAGTPVERSLLASLTVRY